MTARESGRGSAPPSGPAAAPAAPGAPSAGSGARDRWIGLLLFLPVPAVLILFTRLPIGPIPSLLLGLLLMATHPLYARPWACARAGRRCLWCGGPAGGDAIPLVVEDPRGRVAWAACGDDHAAQARRTLAFAWRGRRFLRAGILGTLALFLPGAILASRGLLGPVTVEDASAFFRLAIAVTVLPLGWLGPRGGAPDGAHSAARSPFPIHLAALIGVRAVLWLFRLVGILWLWQGARHFALRTGIGWIPEVEGREFDPHEDCC